MTNVTFQGLPDGTATLHYAARVEPHRQGLVPRPTPISSPVVAAGQVTVDLTPRIEYVLFSSDGRPHHAMVSATRGWPS